MVRRVMHLLAAVAIGTAGLSAHPSSTAAAGMVVQRLAGADRFATAAAVSAAHFAPGVPAAYVATGANFPDALAAGPAAALARAPILLVTPTGIPAPTQAELARLQPGRIVVLGLAGAVSDPVVAALDAYDTGGGVVRLGGADRYATAAAISAAHFGPGVSVAYVATGANFPDALTGGVAAARAGGPLLLTRGDALPPATVAELQRLAPQQIVVLGGPGVVSDAVVGGLRTLAASGVVTRLAGADRYGTAVAVSQSSFAGGSSAMFVATGRTFPDAMVAAPAAVLSDAPVLLVPGGVAPASVLAEARRLTPGRVVLLGGQSVVTDRVTFDVRVAIGDLAPLPPCTYEDILTPLTGYADWHRTLLDTRLTLTADYHPQDLVETSAAGLNGGYLLRTHVAADLRAMADAARGAGRPIQVASAFRSYAVQQQTFDHWVSVNGYDRALRTSARAGHSEHQLGTTFDFTSLNGRPPWEYADWASTPAGAWMAANAWRYGFVMSYPRGAFDRVCYDYEPWHYRYVGRDVAAAVQASGLTLREWLWMTGSGG